MYTIGITGVGGGVGQSILKSLQNSNYNLIAMDGEVLAAGLYTTNKAYKIPYANASNFVDSILKICINNKINFLFPGLDAELYVFAKNKEKFAAIGTTVMVSSLEVIDIAEDKLITYQKLTQLGFNVPFTQKLTQGISNFSYPFIVKPYIGGARSKDVFLIKNDEQFKIALEKINTNINNFIVQEYLDGDEYTCGTITLNNVCKGAIVMKRELRAGDTYKCFTVDDASITNYLIKLMNTIQPFGACNVQLKLKNGEPYIFEINARCSGTTAARTLCGFNEPLMVANYYLQNIEPQFEIKQKSILRYWKELEVDNDAVATMLQNGYIETNTTNKL